MKAISLTFIPRLSQQVTYISSSLFDKLHQLCKKIRDFVVSLFQKIALLFSRQPKKIFDSQEVKLLRDDRKITIPPPLTTINERDFSVLPVPLAPEDLTTHPQDTAPPYLTFDASLESLRGFVRDLSALVVNIIHTKHVQGEMKSFQNLGPALTVFVKSIVRLLIETGDKSTKPIFQRLTTQKNQPIDPGLHKIIKTLLRQEPVLLQKKIEEHLNAVVSAMDLTLNPPVQSYVKPIVTWTLLPESQRPSIATLLPAEQGFAFDLAEELGSQAQAFYNKSIKEDQDQLYSDLEKKICQRLKEHKIPAEQDVLKDYVHPVLDWFLRSDYSTPLGAHFVSYEPKQLQLVDTVFECVVVSLTERKIDHYTRVLNINLNGRLDGIIHRTSRLNASRIADFFSQRFSELISTMPFSQTFDRLLHHVAIPHVKGYVSAETALETHKAILEKAPLIAKSIAKTPEELENKMRAENHLASVVKYGSDEAFLQHMLVEEFAAQPGCGTPYLKQVIEQSLAQIAQSKDPAESKRINRKLLYTQLADTLLSILMSNYKKTVGNETVEIDPYMELWNCLHFPVEFHDFIRQFENLSAEFVTPYTAMLFEKIQQPVMEGIKNLFKVLMQDLLRKSLIAAVETSFKKLTAPDAFDDMNAEHSLPSINKQLIKTLINHELHSNLKALVPLFHALINDEDAHRQTHQEAIKQALIKYTKATFHHFNEKEFFAREVFAENNSYIVHSELADNDWNGLVQPIIEDAEKALRKQDKRGAALTSAVIIDTITKNAQIPGRPNDPMLGELIMDLMFRVGDPSYHGVANFFIKDFLSKELSNNTQKIRVSHQFLIENIAESLKGSLLNPDRLKELMFGKPRHPQHVQEKLIHQLDVTSRLTYDLILHKVENKNFAIRLATKSFLTDQPNKVHMLFQTVYRKLFSIQSLNENLLTQLCQELFKSLRTAEDPRRLTHHRTTEIKVVG